MQEKVMDLSGLASSVKAEQEERHLTQVPQYLEGTELIRMARVDGLYWLVDQ